MLDVVVNLVVGQVGEMDDARVGKRFRSVHGRDTHATDDPVGSTREGTQHAVGIGLARRLAQHRLIEYNDCIGSNQQLVFLERMPLGLDACKKDGDFLNGQAGGIGLVNALDGLDTELHAHVVQQFPSSWRVTAQYHIIFI